MPTARESSEVASEVASALTHREDRPNPTENVDYDVGLNRNNLYSMTSLPYNQNDIARQQGEILGPLSLFAPYVHEEEIVDEDLTPSRPETPVDEEIKAPISTFKQLCRYVLRRITADKSKPYLDVDDQEDLAGVLLGELNAIWTEYHKLPDDPFLNREQNLELKRLMVVRMVEICKLLFNQYIDKAQILNRRGVFTGPANVSRLKAQLGLEAHRELNVPSIRRWAAEMMKGDYSSSSDDEVISDKLSKKSRRSRSSRRQKSSVPSFRPSPRRKSPKRKPFTLENEIKEMDQEMPPLQTERLMSILDDMDHIREKPRVKTTSKFYSPDEDDEIMEVVGPRKKRSNSMDETERKETLADELELELEFTLKRSDSTHLINIPCLMRNPEATERMATENLLSHDLDRLMARPEASGNDEEISDDMPPLLQAITRHAKHDNKRPKIDKQLKELAKKEEKYKERQKVQPHEKPRYPQPDTVTGRMPNKMDVRASDVRVSERVCMSSFTINKFGPLYNDLNGDVDAATVKAMDKNLFMGDEIKEVYHEIMKTIPTDHLTMSNDELIIPAADSVNVSSVLMPSALYQRKKEKIVNKTLQKSQQPPWKNQNVLQWAKTPVNQLKDVKSDMFGNLRKVEEDVSSIPGMVLNYDDYVDQLADCPRQVQERLSRNYQSWLTWWKSTLNSEDYQKYLASQETDFLCYMFHYYDSDGEEDEDDGKSVQTGGKKSFSRQSDRVSDLAEKAQLNELRALKSEYTPGLWNPRTVLMGGLGKDPVLDEDRPSAPSPVSEVTEVSCWNIGNRLTVKTDGSRRHSAGESELSKTILNKENEARDEAKRIAELNRPKGPSPQERLEKVWTILQMPDHLKLDMAIKYSSDEYNNLLKEAIEVWEKAANLITEREKMMTKLENFERSASDPNRYFLKGIRGSSKARLDEAKDRSRLYKELDEMEPPIKDFLTKVERDFDDKISFQGRPYVDKMQWDRIEMLFWLQEERKQNVLEKQSIAKGLRTGVCRLDTNIKFQQSAA